MTRVELVLVNGAKRIFDLPAGTSSVANALARLDDWIQTVDAGWVQKRHIVEVRPVAVSDASDAGVEYEALDAAAAAMTEDSDESAS